MSEGRILQPGEGEMLELRPPGRSGSVTILVDPRNSGAGRLAVGTQELVPGGAIPPHFHERQEEVLLIRSGAGIATLGDRRVPVAAGAVLYVPEGVRHGVENPGPDPLALLWVISPPGLEEMFREIGAPPGEPAEALTGEEFAAIAARHGVHVG